MPTLRGHEVPEEAQRRLQLILDAKNAREEPDVFVPTFIAIYRHECKSARGVKEGGKGISTAMDLHERYAVNPDDRSFAMLYREGKCRCGLTARSKEGLYIETSKRPPISGRVARG